MPLRGVGALSTALRVIKFSLWLLPHKKEILISGQAFIMLPVVLWFCHSFHTPAYIGIQNILQKNYV